MDGRRRAISGCIGEPICNHREWGLRRDEFIGTEQRLWRLFPEALKRAIRAAILHARGSSDRQHRRRGFWIGRNVGGGGSSCKRELAEPPGSWRRKRQKSQPAQPGRDGRL